MIACVDVIWSVALAAVSVVTAIIVWVIVLRNR